MGRRRTPRGGSSPAVPAPQPPAPAEGSPPPRLGGCWRGGQARGQALVGLEKEAGDCFHRVAIWTLKAPKRVNGFFLFSFFFFFKHMQCWNSGDLQEPPEVSDFVYIVVMHFHLLRFVTILWKQGVYDTRKGPNPALYSVFSSSVNMRNYFIRKIMWQRDSHWR